MRRSSCNPAARRRSCRGTTSAARSRTPPFRTARSSFAPTITCSVSVCVHEISTRPHRRGAGVRCRRRARSVSTVERRPRSAWPRICWTTRRRHSSSWPRRRSQWIRRRPATDRRPSLAANSTRHPYFLVRLPDGQAHGFRDVGRVDGKTTARDGRPMADLLSSAVDRCGRGSPRHDPRERETQHRQRLPHAQCPPSVTELFSHRFQNRFDFHDAGRERVNGLAAVVLGLREVGAECDGDGLAATFCRRAGSGSILRPAPSCGPSWVLRTCHGST